MSEETTKPIAEQISASLSDALFRANHAKGVLILMATDDDTIWTFSAGDLVVKLGLIRMAVHKGQEMVDESIHVEEDDE
ncbi:MAG: hypothetical protein IMZ71_05685 [Chloroflexi bacterium]|nr:hypothetical protein [Chloroflexota bacterium]